MKVFKFTQLQKRVFNLVRKIPLGKVASYKELAKKAGKHPRAVARALAANPSPIKIPCHRVIYADGRLGGYTPSGKARKIELLKKEGIQIKKGKIGKDYFYFLR